MFHDRKGVYRHDGGSFMNSGFALLLTFGIGVVAGLRSMTAPAIVAWAAHLGWINLSGSHLAFIGSAWAVGIFTLGALVEFIADQRPTTPARTTAVPLAARIVIGSLTGACLCIAGGAPLWLGLWAGRSAQSLEHSAAIRLASDWFEPFTLRTLQLPFLKI